MIILEVTTRMVFMETSFVGRHTSVFLSVFSAGGCFLTLK